ncbi:MAG: hypothetical protein D6725_05255, partial [Planctomycetota bacterium]
MKAAGHWAFNRRRWLASAASAVGACCCGHGWAAPGTRDSAVSVHQAREALRRAVTFARERLSVRGGYVFRWSADLKRREGEERVGPRTAWIQPPATPA